MSDRPNPSELQKTSNDSFNLSAKDDGKQKNLWQDLKSPENMGFVITALLAFGVAILGILPGVSVSVLVATVLAVLGGIVSFIFIAQRTMLRIGSQLDHQKSFNARVADQIEQSLLRVEGQLDAPSVGRLFRPFSELDGEIRQAIKSADQIWLLSRTGRGWWQKYGRELEEVLKKNKENRFLFLDPADGPLKMIVASAQTTWGAPPRNWNDLRQDVVGFLNFLHPKASLTLKVINHLPAWALLIVNPQEKNDKSVIYVELATFCASAVERPVFKINLSEVEYFGKFLREFETMWEAARLWDGVPPEVHPLVSDVVRPFSELDGEIRRALKSAEQVWLLSRTGQRWWENFESEMKTVLKRNAENRFLLLDPENGALRMVAKAAWRRFYQGDPLEEGRKYYLGFLHWLKQQEAVRSKVIDHLPAWTLLFINPEKKNDESVIYVELATYHAGAKVRPVFKVTFQDKEYFGRFIEEYEEMWKAAREW